jgi:hypothetical protein
LRSIPPTEKISTASPTNRSGNFPHVSALRKVFALHVTFDYLGTCFTLFRKKLFERLLFNNVLMDFLGTNEASQITFARGPAKQLVGR